MNSWPGSKTVLITGGTGSFGKGFANLLLQQEDIKMVRIFSRDEHKQRQLRQEISSDRISFYIGDIRDKDRLYRAMDGVDWVVHAAALKQSPLGEIEPEEFIKTNVTGSIAVKDAAIDAKVKKCLLISSDKAVEPINLYGASKMCAERVFQQADAMRGTSETRFAFTRYGNVVGTAGSVVPYYASLPANRPTPVTHVGATRFWITLPSANQFVLDCLRRMVGGECFIPKMKSVRIIDLARAMRPDVATQLTGLRPGDKIHELVSSDPRQSSGENEFLTPDEILRDIQPFMEAKCQSA
jgi:UDP-N-acetylglucosamine 4,6-dehydratase